MQLGDFFKSATHARPVNPRPITFTAVAKGPILPGGEPNRHKRPVAARLVAAMVFLGGDGAESARIEARQDLQKRFVDSETKMPLTIDAIDLSMETVYQELWRILHEWDPEAKLAGERLFPTASSVRELVEPDEARRIYRAYMEYVKDEHPEGLDDATFRDAQGGGAGAPPRKSG
jgi:hypothetical protein